MPQNQTLSRADKLQEQEDRLMDLKARQIEAAANEDKSSNTVSANKSKDVKIPDAEKDMVHVRVTNRNLSPDQKSFIEDTRIIKVHARQFDQKVREGMFAGFDLVDVVHDPRHSSKSDLKFKPEPVIGETLDIPLGAHNPNIDLIKQRQRADEERAKALPNIVPKFGEEQKPSEEPMFTKEELSREPAKTTTTTTTKAR